MSSLNADFNELLDRIRAGREFAHASFEPIFYLVFSPERIIEVKRQMPAWMSKLKKGRWKPSVFSIAAEINDIFESSPHWRIWLTAEAKAPLQWERANSALTNAVCNGYLQERLEKKLNELQGDPRSILLVSDLEALHPYMRIGVIEGGLQGKFSVPTIFLYPGVRTGKTRLKFLGFYPEDGNYRSVHVGG